jgi:hypothetical protein
LKIYKKNSNMKAFALRVLRFLGAFFAWFFGARLEQERPEKEQDIWEKSRALHTKLKQGWDAQQTAAQLPLSPLTEYCQDALGNVYYINAAGLDVNVDRVHEIERARLAVFHGIDELYIAAYFEQMDKALATKNIGLIGALHSDFKVRKNKLPAMEMLLNLACLYVYRHDENPYVYDSVMQHSKLETAKAIPELRAFFLRLSWGVLVREQQELSPQQRGWSDKKETDFQLYLAGQLEMRTEKPNPKSPNIP